MKSVRLPVLFAAISLLALTGCTKEPGDGAAPMAEKTISPAATVPRLHELSPPATTGATPVLRAIDEKQLADILKKHLGKVVLVDFWATWCTECLELMPHTVAIREELAGRGLQVILVSLDSPEDRRDMVEKSLADNGAKFDSYISRYGGDPKSAEAFQIESAALPNIKLYDRKGTLRKVFSAGRMPPEPFTAADVEQAVRELLAE